MPVLLPEERLLVGAESRRLDPNVRSERTISKVLAQVNDGIASRYLRVKRKIHTEVMLPVDLKT